MIGRNTVKRACKRLAGQLTVLTVPFVPRPRQARACILMYHRVADIGFIDPHVDDWTVAPALFARQIAGLASQVEFVPLLELPARLTSAAAKPLVAITFDDGFSGVHRHALPVLQQYRVPATLFLVTKYLGHAGPMAFDRWGRKHQGRVPADAWRPLNWAEVEECLATGLVTIGCHSHEHLDARYCTSQQLAEEVGQSTALLASRLGPASTRAYAYPYGSTRLGQAPTQYVKAVQEAGYQLAVCTRLSLAQAADDPYLLPRVEAGPTDSPTVLRVKVRGALLACCLTDRLRGYFSKPWKQPAYAPEA